MKVCYLDFGYTRKLSASDLYATSALSFVEDLNSASAFALIALRISFSIILRSSGSIVSLVLKKSSTKNVIMGV